MIRDGKERVHGVEQLHDVLGWDNLCFVSNYRQGIRLRYASCIRLDMFWQVQMLRQWR